MTVRKFVPENRLSKAFSDGSGMLIAHALQHADANLSQARPRHLTALKVKVDRLRDLAHGSEETRDDLYRMAREIGGDAGALGLTHMSQAAFSLCDLLVCTMPRPRLLAAVVVHVDAIVALQPEAGRDAPASEAILRGLFNLSGRTANNPGG